MSGNDKFPNMLDGRETGTFKHGMSRRQELLLRQELDGMTKRSLSELKVRKENERNEPLTQAQLTTHMLLPEFRPTRFLEKRKTHPIFHDVNQPNTVRPKSPKPVVPPYNALDREDSSIAVKEDPKKSNKFPFKKEQVKTTEEMKEPHVSSVGVIPTRESYQIKDLKVIMEGKPAMKTDTDPVIGPIERANTAILDEDKKSKEEDEYDPILNPKPPGPKPAIIAGTGTLRPVAMAERPLPAPKPKTKLKPLKIDRTHSARSATQDENGDEEGEGSLSRGGSSTPHKSRNSSAHTVKSVKDLLEEAKQLAIPAEGEVKYMQKARSKFYEERKDGKKSVRTADKRGKSGKSSMKSSQKSVSLKSDPKDESKTRDRTVDEIIASLKESHRPGGASEADKKIQEIMQRVLSRTAAVLGTDVDGSGQEQEGTQPDGQPLVTPRSETLRGKTGLSLPLTEEDGSHKENKTVTLTSTEIDFPESEPQETETERTGYEDATTVISQAETAATTYHFSEPPPAIQEALDQLSEVGVLSTDDKEGERAQDKGKRTKQETSTPDLRLAWEDLMAPRTVRYEDVLNVTAQPAQIHESKPPAGQEPETHMGGSTFLSTWMPVEDMPDDIESVVDVVEEAKDKPKAKAEKSIHHFCTFTDDMQLPDHYRGVWRRYHVPSKHDITPSQKSERSTPSAVPNQPIDSCGVQYNLSESHNTSEDREKMMRIQSAAARRILDDANRINDTSTNTMEAWAERAQQVFDVSNMGVDGKKMELKTDESFMFWTPAPPKWDVAPAVVKKHLFPGYHGAALAGDMEGSKHLEDEEEEEEEEEEIIVDTMDPEDRLAHNRVLARTYGSASDLTYLQREMMQREEDIKMGRVTHQTGVMSKSASVTTMTTETGSGTNMTATGRQRAGMRSELDSVSEGATQSDASSVAPANPTLSFADLRARFTMAVVNQQEESIPSEMPDEEIFPVFPARRRRKSAPGVLVGEDDYILVFEDYNTVMADFRKQQKQMRDIKEGRRDPPCRDQPAATKEEVIEVKNVVEPDYRSPERLEPISEKSGLSPDKLSLMSKKKDEPTPAERALQAGRAYVLLPQKKTSKRKVRPLDMARVEALERFLAQEPNNLTRTESIPMINRVVERELRVPKKVRSRRRGSVPASYDFDEYEKRRGYKPGDDPDSLREFYRSVWNIWFDQTFPPTPPESEWEEDESEEPEEEIKEEKPKRKMSTASVYSENMEVDPIIEDEEDEMTVQMIENEIEELTYEIESSDNPRAFDLARRGALYRKVGRFKGALMDLNRAITIEPLLLNAYWHRHIIYLLQNNRKKALEDLNVLLKHAKNNAGAYRSRAAIYRRENDITMAIVNYTQAIKLNPDDYEAYYQRAEMYEKRGEMLLAMEDYATATKLMPSKTEALFRHGLHYFNNGNWQAAVNDFTELLKVDPSNAKSRMFRGRAFSQLKQWNQAVEDLSAAVHLDPKDYLAFYYRGCILRKLHPKRALQDFSVSLLINNTEDNILSYLHRGILYTDVGSYDDAIPDFEAVLKLDKDMAVAHVNLGLIYMLHLDNHHRAIKKFTAALKADPTYIKAYICRAEAYTRVHDIKNALLDFTRAIHLRPDVGHFYMYRGQLVLQTGNLELAAFCVRHAAELNAGLGQSPTQQAIVQSFLKNYDKAVDALNSATKVTPVRSVAPLYVLLGKTQMKARSWKDAVKSFEKALEAVKMYHENSPWPAEAAEMNYLIGMCQIEVRDYLGAHDAFNNAIRVDPKYSEAYYQRGLVRMKLKQSKGIQDFNRALALNPKLFQAYLSRAAYFGLKNRYTKGILNCNEAIKLQPNSVRAYLSRGALKYHIKAYDLAIRDLTTAAAIDNTCSLAYFNRAVCYHDSGNWIKALQDYGIVLLLGDQLKLKVLINRGLLYFDHKDYLNALHDFLVAAKVNPTDPKVHHTLGLCYHKLWKLEAAVKSFSRAIELSRFFLDAYIGRGNVFMDFGHDIGHRYAKRDYERALMLDPQCLAARVNLGYNLQVAGRYQLAWHQFSAAIHINQRYKPALEGRAIINLQMSDTFAAFQDIHAAITVSPTAELLTNRGVIYQFMNDRVNAIRDYQEALKHDPTYALAYFNAANVYFHMRQFKQAIAYFSQAITYNPKDESAHLNRAITKVLLRDAKGALADFEKAVSLSPYSAHVYFNRGNLYTSLSMWDKAEEDYSKALSLQPDDAMVLKRRADVRGKLGRRDIAIKDYQRAIQLQSAKIRIVPAH